MTNRRVDGRTLSPGSDLVILERGWQARWFASAEGSSRTGWIAAPTCAEAAMALQLLGCPYVDIEEFAGNSDPGLDQNAIYATQLEWIDQVDRSLQRDISEFETWNFRPAFMSLAWIRRLVEALYLRTRPLHFILAHTTHRLRYPLVSCESPSSDSRIGSSFACSYHASLTTALLDALRNEHPGRVVPISIPDLSPQSPAAESPALLATPAAGSGPVWRYLRPTLRACRELMRMARGRMRRDGMWVRILTHDDYDLSYVNALLRRRGARLLPFPQLHPHEGQDAAAVDLGDRVWNALQSCAAIRELERRLSLPATPFLSVRAENWGRFDIPHSFTLYRAADEYLRRRRIDAVVASNALHGDGAMELLCAAGAQGIPRAIYSHGCDGGALRVAQWDIGDLPFADYELVYGCGDARSCQLLAARYPNLDRARPVAVGSARLDAYRRVRTRSAATLGLEINPGHRSRVVVYAATTMAGDTRYIDGNTHPDLPYLDLQLEMLDALAAEADWQLVYRPFFEMSNAVVQWLGEHHPEVAVDRSHPLVDLMRSADLVVLDAVSTGLLEALTVGCSVVVLAWSPYVELDPVARELLLRCTDLCTTREGLLATLRRRLAPLALNTGQVPNRGFLRHYALHLDDGRSAQRAAAFIASMSRSGLERQSAHDA